jgi:hypothetical protein
MKLSHHLLLLVLLATPCLAKSASTQKKEPTALQKCEIRDAAEKTQVGILEEYITGGYTFSNITMNGKPLLATTEFSSDTVELLLRGGADPLATIITDEGTIFCIEKWAICALQATKKTKRNKKIEILIFMMSHLLRQEKHEAGTDEAVAKVRKLLKNHPKILHQLPTASSHLST